MPGCTAPWICYQWFTPLHRETTNEHCVEAAPCPHCHCRTDILQGVLTAPLGNYHCTSKAQSLKGQSCSKLMFTILHGLYISHSLPVCWSLCVSVALVKEWHVWLTKITAEMVCFTKCILQRKILRKMWCSYLCWNSPYYTNLAFSLQHSFVAFSGPWQFCYMMKYGKSCILVSCIFTEVHHYPTETIVGL